MHLIMFDLNVINNDIDSNYDRPVSRSTQTRKHSEK